MAYEFRLNKILFPVTPSKIKIKIKNQNKTINLVNEGEVNVLKNPGLTEIEVGELLLPLNKGYPFAMYENGKFLKPKYFLDELEKWKKNKKVITFSLARFAPSGKSLDFSDTKKVSVEDYTIVEDAEKYGMDICVQINLKEYISWGTKKIIKNNKASSTSSKKNTSKTYTVKKGDTLMSIAKKKLGKSSKWKTLYKLNKKVIEKAAKKHGRKSSSNGRYIYKGTKLKLK